MMFTTVCLSPQELPSFQTLGALESWLEVNAKCNLNRACLQNEDDFPEPDVFKPERYLDGVKLKEGSVLAKEFAFGYGRR